MSSITCKTMTAVLGLTGFGLLSSSTVLANGYSGISIKETTEEKKEEKKEESEESDDDRMVSASPPARTNQKSEP
ncbi:hypothetical protein MHLP_03865 [Candidatus Mycoplasma haematolamae str. Purdue]|uniref:Uncharacterized protein n=1 Tax=Mycoplasma haematolamae (strain Purdue) TaxID=1212765 RepID=I7BKE0_MYCHA|nr:hypothetical protein [Candidatus Mycoplasma haematolamae]AFO52353.1 hypothetical protein MHLP_03865 [Candidatus Mycoplasma haematolamae str. Purdue]